MDEREGNEKVKLHLGELFEIHGESLTDAKKGKSAVLLASPEKPLVESGLPGTVILKQLDETSERIYEELIGNSSPYIQKVYCIEDTLEGRFAVCEFIERPGTFDGVTYGAYEGKSVPRMLSLGNLIESPMMFPFFNHDPSGGEGFFTEKNALKILLMLCDGMLSFSKEKIVHGDLAPQNILLADPIGEDPELPFRPVIIDFGASKQVKNDQHALTTIESTKPFMAPEMLAYNKSNDRADIYSLGCILYYMILGKVPGQNANGLKDSRGSLSRPVYRIIDKCNADYDTRYRSIKELRRDILRVMKHGTSTAYRVISAIPGFRTHNIWKMIIVVYIYAALLHHNRWL